MSTRYRRVQQHESNTGQENEINKKKRTERVEKITAKLHAILWVIVGVFALIFSNIIKIGIRDDRVNRIALNLAIMTFVANFGIIVYLTLWLPLILKITIPWEIYCPNMIPTSTALGIICLILLNVSFWPIYGLLTPILLVIIFLGLLFSAHFVPWPC